MLVNSKDAEKRLNSPDNLLNRLRRDSPRSIQARSAMSLFVRPEINQAPESNNPFTNLQLIPASINSNLQPVPSASIYQPDDNDQNDEKDLAAEKVLDNLEVKVKEESIQLAAMDVLSKSVRALGKKIENGEVARPKDLADIARKMSGIVTDIKKSDDSTKDKDGKTVHLHFYTPERKKLEDLGEIIDVG